MPAPDSPRGVLDRRYAAGELSTEEYRERVDALDRSGSR
ncbi:putative membrane protein [Galbitalea soli]|nr:putative membrane protein [Galbitalea soli]